MTTWNGRTVHLPAESPGTVRKTCPNHRPPSPQPQCDFPVAGPENFFTLPRTDHDREHVCTGGAKVWPRSAQMREMSGEALALAHFILRLPCSVYSSGGGDVVNTRKFLFTEVKPQEKGWIVDSRLKL